MKKLLLLGAIALGLNACGLSGGTPTQPNGTVNFGTAVTNHLAVTVTGDWRVEDLPDWLTATPASGHGPATLTLTALRPARIDTPSVQGSFRIAWTTRSPIPGGPAASGSARVDVTAEMYTVTGRLNGDVTSSTALSMREAPRAAAPQSRGVIVKYKSATALVRAQKAGAPVLGTAGRLALLESADSQALRALRQDKDVEYAVPNVILHALGTPVTPSDQYAPLQWMFPLTGYGAVWRDMQNAAYPNAVTVAVLDTGVRYDHPDLQGALWLPGEGALDVVPRPDPSKPGSGGDAYGLDTDPTDPGNPSGASGSHGTHVTGLIVARWGAFTPPCPTCSPTGVVGAAFTAPVKVLPIRVLDARGSGDLFSIAQAIRYAAGEAITLNGQTYQHTRPVRVINLSLGGAISAQTAAPLCEAVQAASDRGVLVVAAAGNDYGTSPFYPAACGEAVAVASVSVGRGLPTRAPYSNAYPQVMLSAPGGDGTQALNGATFNGQPFPDVVFSTSWNYRDGLPSYEAMTGTSQAAPQVSALAALLFSKGVVSTAGDALQRIVATATDLGPAGRDDRFGYGMINAAAALGAPAVSSTLGVTLQDGTGASYKVPLDDLGRFTAHPRQGEYRLTGGRDLNGNGIPGEAGEPRAQKVFTLGPDAPERQLGVLSPE